MVERNQRNGRPFFPLSYDLLMFAKEKSNRKKMSFYLKVYLFIYFILVIAGNPFKNSLNFLYAHRFEKWQELPTSILFEKEIMFLIISGSRMISFHSLL